MTTETLAQIQRTLQLLGIPAWLLYNFREQNPIASRMLGLAPGAHQTRRWALLVPAHGQPRGLWHRIEPHIGALMPGEAIPYSSHVEFEQGLRVLISGFATVAMEYSEHNAVPVVARVDAGTVELVRSLGPEVVTSADLIAHIEARLTGDQLESARRAGAAAREVMMDAFRFIRDQVRGGTNVTEYDVQQHIAANFAARGLVTDHSPNCSVGPNSANPHYEPTATASATITAGDFVLIDLWAREAAADAVYGDITWVGYVGADVPEQYTEVFNIVRDARDAAFATVRDAFAESRRLAGAEVDDAARRVIDAAGYGQYFVHRTGHSITTELHGAGANMDNFETRDTRTVLAATSFSIEPGIYLPGRFGVRSELDVVIAEDGQVMATSDPLQQAVIPILTMD